MKYKRIVCKVGTSSLTNEDGSLSRAKVRVITQQLAMLHEAGHEVILVSSGAIAAGFSSLGFKKRPTKIADKQASAAVGQGLLLEEYTTNLLLKKIVSDQILLTQDDFADKRRYKNAHQAISVLLNRGAIPIINVNDTVSIAELKVGDNDTYADQAKSSNDCHYGRGSCLYLFFFERASPHRSRRKSGKWHIFYCFSQKYENAKTMVGFLRYQSRFYLGG